MTSTDTERYASVNVPLAIWEETTMIIHYTSLAADGRPTGIEIHVGGKVHSLGGSADFIARVLEDAQYLFLCQHEMVVFWPALYLTQETEEFLTQFLDAAKKAGSTKNKARFLVQTKSGRRISVTLEEG